MTPISLGRRLGRAVQTLTWRLALVLVLLPATAGAADGDAFSVTVPVDVRAESASAARDKALLDGQVKAFRLLVERLSSAEEAARLPDPDLQKVLTLVRDLAVDQERAVGTRYIATLTVRFKPDPVRALLRAGNVAMVEGRRQPLVVLPVLTRPGEAPVLWDDPNPWRAAWARRPSGGLVPLAVPLGELADLTAVTAEQALAGDAAAIAAIGQRYNTADVLVATALLGPPADGRNTLEVKLTGHGAVPATEPTLSFAAKEDEGPDLFLRRAVDAVVAAIEQGYKRGDSGLQAKTATLSAAVPIGGLGDWLVVRERLGRVALVRGVEVMALRRDQADIQITHYGDGQRLAEALARSGLGLAAGPGGWVLRAETGGPTQ